MLDDIVNLLTNKFLRKLSKEDRMRICDSLEYISVITKDNSEVILLDNSTGEVIYRENL